MKERLAHVLSKLEDMGWAGDAALVVALRFILEHENSNVIEEVFEAFR